MKWIRIKTDTHHHQGEPVPKGTELEVDDATAHHFAEIGVAEIVTKKGKE